MSDFVSMPSRFYKIYANKVRDMPSLKTEDINGAQPRKHTRAKGDILEQYYQTRSQANLQKNNQVNYWEYQLPEKEKPVMKSITATSYVPLPEDYYKFSKREVIPRTVQQRPLAQTQGDNQRDFVPLNDKYQSINNMRNPMYADYKYDSGQQTLSSREPAQYNSSQSVQYNSGQSVQYNGPRDSLDALRYQYEGKNPMASPEQNPRKQNQQELYEMEALMNQRALRNSMDDMRLGDRGMIKSSTTPNLWNNQPQYNQAQYDQQQYEQQQYSQQYNQPQYNIQEQYIQEQYNQGNQYNQDQYNQEQYSQDQYNSQGQGQYRQERADPYQEFEKSRNKFFGADESSPSRQAKREQGNIFKEKKEFYTLNPLTQAPILRYQKGQIKYEKPKITTIKDEWHFKKNLETFFQ